MIDYPSLTITLTFDPDVTAEQAEHAAFDIFTVAFAHDLVIAGDYETTHTNQE